MGVLAYDRALAPISLREMSCRSVWSQYKLTFYSLSTLLSTSGLFYTAEFSGCKSSASWGGMEEKKPYIPLLQAHGSYSFKRRGSGEGDAALFSLGSSDKMYGMKLHQGRLDIRKHFFGERVVKNWNSVLFLERWSMPQAASFKRHFNNCLNTRL